MISLVRFLAPSSLRAFLQFSARYNGGTSAYNWSCCSGYYCSSNNAEDEQALDHFHSLYSGRVYCRDEWLKLLYFVAIGDTDAIP